MSIYFNNPWKPIPHTFIKDTSIREQVHNKGYYLAKWNDLSVIKNLKELYQSHHEIQKKDGGMFYSIYSQNIEYRMLIHNSIKKILNDIYEEFFSDYKVMLSMFVTKVSGPKSQFYIHQDTTGLDEWEYSPLSLWIPLQNVNESNGCLGLIPYSHRFFSPYRSISFPSPFEHIQDNVISYMQPIRMKPGDILIFDNRIVHHSYGNNSGEDRIAVVSGIFPKEAKLITCFKPEYKCGGKVERIEHDDDYLLTGKNFLIDCQKRPDSGKSLGWIDDPYPEISVEEFEQMCKMYGIEKYDTGIRCAAECNMIGEPT